MKIKRIKEDIGSAVVCWNKSESTDEAIQGSVDVSNGSETLWQMSGTDLDAMLAEYEIEWGNDESLITYLEAIGVIEETPYTASLVGGEVAPYQESRIKEKFVSMPLSTAQGKDRGKTYSVKKINISGEEYYSVFGVSGYNYGDYKDEETAKKRAKAKTKVGKDYIRTHKPFVKSDVKENSKKENISMDVKKLNPEGKKIVIEEGDKVLRNKKGEWKIIPSRVVKESKGDVSGKRTFILEKEDKLVREADGSFVITPARVVREKAEAKKPVSKKPVKK